MVRQSVPVFQWICNSDLQRVRWALYQRQMGKERFKPVDRCWRGILVSFTES